MKRTPLLFSLVTLFAIGCDKDKDGVSNGDDCAPENADISPDAAETCNGIDDDCDGVIDEGAKTVFYADNDADGFGDANLTTEACEAPPGFLEDNTDCQPLDPNSYPGAQEVCDDIDNDCDNLVDSDDDSVDGTTGQTYYADADQDGYGDPDSTEQACGTPTGFVDNADDCDDANGDVNPETVWFADFDSDGYGDDAYQRTSCEQPDGYTALGGDCNEADVDINPSVAEICDGIDQDCDGVIPGDETDDDGDSFVECAEYVGADELWGGDCDDTVDSIYPGALEFCDGLDNDCDGTADHDIAVPTDYATIQDAIDAATDGQSICIEAGTYAENLWVGDKTVTLAGAGSDSTVIDGSGLESVLYVDSDGVELIGLELTNGYGDVGAAIYADGASLVLNDVNLTDHLLEGYYGEGVVSIAGGDLTANDVEFSGNVADVSYFYGLVYASGATFDVSDIAFYENDFDSDYSFYGLFYAAGGAGDFDGVALYDNTYYQNSSYSSFFPGIYTAPGSISNVEIHGNTVENAGYGYGWVNYSSADDVSLDHWWVAGNSVVARYLYGIFYAYNTAVDMTNIAVAGNDYTVVYNYGWAFYASSYTELALTNADFVGNSLTAQYTNYAPFRGSTSSSISLTNVNLVDNAQSGVDATVFYGSSSSATFDMNYSNTTGNDPGSYTIYEAYTEKNMSAAVGNIESDPEYTDVTDTNAANWDLSLATGSPAIDAGDPEILDADGSTSDIGAYGGPEGDSW